MTPMWLRSSVGTDAGQRSGRHCSCRPRRSGEARKAWDAAHARFFAGGQSSSNSSAVFVLPGAGINDEGFVVALEEQ